MYANFSFTWMQNGLKIDMKVYMQHNGKIVARGVVKVIGQDKICRFSLLGVDKVGVQVSEVIDGGIPLTYDPFFDHLEDALENTIVWPVNGVKVDDEEKTKVFFLQLKFISSIMYCLRILEYSTKIY